MPDIGDVEPMVDQAFEFMGVGLLEDEIDDVIFQTNQFLLNSDFIGSNGPFWWILQMSMCLAALFSIIMAAGITYKMQVRHEPLDVLKILKVLGVSFIMMFWYPPTTTGIGPQNVDGSFLSLLSYIPNCIGSYTNALYETEAAQVQQKYDEVVPYIKQLNDSVTAKREEYTFLLDKLKNTDDSALDMGTADDMRQQEKEITAQYAKVVDGWNHRVPRQTPDVPRPDYLPYRLVGDDVRPADPVGYADYLRPDTMGVLPPSQVGKLLGEVDYTIPDSPFLRSHALFRRLLCPAAL